MAGFEVVVRPVVFPDIRPAPARSLPPQDDPAKGICVITGGSSFPVQLSFSTSVNTSKSKPVETERRSDEVRVYQMDDDGTVNRDNFVDVKAANRIKMRKQDAPQYQGSSMERPRGFDLNEVSYYQRVEESDNIEILRRDVVEKSDLPGAGG